MYDIIILGGGPAGYTAAERAGHAGLKTVLIEERALGGVCLNEGCIPSKTLLNSSKIYGYAKDSAKYGVSVKEAAFDQKTVIERKNRVVKNLVGGIRSKMKAGKITVKDCRGEIIKREGNVISVKAGDEILTANKLLVATGSKAIVPPIPGVKEGYEAGYVLTNREILDLEKVPESMVVVGAGVIGLEMANYYAAVGTKVTVIEMLDKIAPGTDPQIADILKKNLEKLGVVFKLSSEVTAVKKGTVEYKEKGELKTANAEYTLMSIGRKPVTEGFGLENLNVAVEDGHIVVDDKCSTNIPGVYAAGDVNGVWMLAHAAYREAEVAINNILGKKDIMRYEAVPSVIYTNPEVAVVGETENSCKEKGIDYKIANITMNYSGRYMAENEKGDGICKLIVDSQRQRVIGCHIIGSYASEIIIAAGMLIETEMRIEDIKEFVFPHPTVCEVIREAVFLIN